MLGGDCIAVVTLLDKVELIAVRDHARLDWIGCLDAITTDGS